MPDRIVRYLFRKARVYPMVSRLSRGLNDHRGRFLVLFATIYTCFGYSYIVEGATTQRRSVFVWLPDMVPMMVLSTPWFLAAVIALMSAFKRSLFRTDRYGFMALATVPCVWALTFLFAHFAGRAPTGWISTLIYGGFAAIVVVVSSWPNPPTLDGRSLLDGAE